MKPSYLCAYQNGNLAALSKQLWEMLSSCELCPRRCRINRLKDEKGFCRTGKKASVYSYMAHFGEEPPISGSRGSGTIFFSNCNLGCVYCQNFQFSQKEAGRGLGNEELASLMLTLQQGGCHNINLVTPTHVLPQILKALEIGCAQGLSIPIIYNTSGYELPEVIAMLDGIVDVYLADMRYADQEMSRKYSGAPDYPQMNRASVKEMHRQTGACRMDKDGIIEKGLIVRHLVLPNDASGTNGIMRFLAEEISPETYVSLMSQYTPYHKAHDFPELDRRITSQEFSHAEELMEKYELHNGWIQESGGLSDFAGTNIKPNIP